MGLAQMKRQHNKTHLAFIRQLPCVICGDGTTTEACHVRFAEPRAAKRPTGMGERPDDVWTVPLCGKHHRDQHQCNERSWWESYRIDPTYVALALQRVTGNVELGAQIVAHNAAPHR